MALVQRCLQSSLKSVFTSCLLERSSLFVRPSVWIINLHSYSAQAQKSNQKNAQDEERTGKELDIKRPNPYAGLTMGQKGNNMLFEKRNI